MTPPTDSESGIKAIETTITILESIQAQNGARGQEIANDTGLTSSTVHRHLRTLNNQGYVVQEGDEYNLSFRFVEFGEFVQHRKPEFDLARDTVAELAARTEERAQYFVEEHGKAVYVCYETGKHGVKTDAHVGKRIPLHASGGGKAILAHLPDERVDEIIEHHGLPALAENTITDRETLLAELEQIRDQGYSFNKQEYSVGSRAVGAPVIDNNGQLRGALSVTGPTLRMTGDWFNEELPNLLLGVANELVLNISY